MRNTNIKELYPKLAHCIRALTIDAVEAANSGHPGMPLGMADVATVLFAEFLKFNPKDANWQNRDRFILSAGHGSMLLYSLLYLTGYEDISLDDIKKFRQLHSKTAGHPEYGLLGGVETTTGPLGQGIATAVGMAIAQNKNAASLHKDILDHKIYVIVGDGCLMEGISHEACSFAGHLNLNQLVVLYDSNDITIDGKKGLADSENVVKRFEGYGWNVQSIDGHNFDEILHALKNVQNSTTPSIIICTTKIGYGAPHKEKTEASHGSPLGEYEAKLAKASYGWPTDKTFFVPENLLKVWREDIGARHHGAYKAWQERVASLTQNMRDVVDSINHLNLDYKVINQELSDLKKKIANDKKAEATRQSSGAALEYLNKVVSFIGGSADLTTSNYTQTRNMRVITDKDFSGNYLHYGVRENAMSAIMNGISLYGGYIPYGGTFLVFVDYMRPSVRMSALMHRQVIYVLTHDSIGVGEDGPTHQPIEHIASLRAMPNINVFRPADATETTECWELALQNTKTPSVICLTRQKVSQLRTQYEPKNLCSHGAYIISEHVGELKVTIYATGSEVDLAVEAQELLHKHNIGTRVVSIPCMELFDAQPEEYRKSLLDNSSIKVGVEAAIKFGWERYIGQDGIFVGMSGFGASGPSDELYKSCNITTKNIISSVSKKLGTAIEVQ